MAGASMERCRGTACGEWKIENGKWKVSQGCRFVPAAVKTVCTNCVCSSAHCAAVGGFAAAKGSSNDYDITPKELDSRRIPESGCRVLEDYFRQQYDWTTTVDEARLVKFRVSFTGELDGQLNVRAVCYQTGGHWYLDLSAVNLNLFS